MLLGGNADEGGTDVAAAVGFVVVVVVVLDEDNPLFPGLFCALFPLVGVIAIGLP